MNTKGLLVMTLERRDKTGKVSSLSGSRTSGGKVIPLTARDSLRWRCSCGGAGRWRSIVGDRWPRVTLTSLWHKHMIQAHHAEAIDNPVTRAHNV